MPEESVATPGSAAESGTPGKSLAAKDRACPYCNTYFTSSSLGRHLDLYIKEKNPKPPDGIHDIEAIRRSRGNITRRQARTSSAKREGSTPSSSKQTPGHDQRSPSISRQFQNGDQVEKAQFKTYFNSASWHQTGVINDIPPTPRDGSSRHESRRDQPRRLPLKTEVAQRQKALEERDRGRAAELALREVLDSVKAANVRAHPPAPFEYDWFGQTFPSLCLRCLPRPAAILSSIPISNSSSWPTSPPGSLQLDALRQRLNSRLNYWRKLSKPPNHTNGITPLNNTDSVAKEDESYHEHLDTAFSAWSALPESRKHEIWHLESLRALAREQQDHAETHLKLQRVEQEAANLRAQLDRLNNCQQPRDFILFPPSTLPLSREAVDAMDENMLNKDWDADALLEKWKSRLQSGRGKQKALPEPRQDLAATTMIPLHHLNNSGSDERAFKAQRTTNGHLHDYALNQQPDDGDASDSDLMDAPGDEDEDVAGQNGELAGLLDPKLRERRDDVMQGVEGNFGERGFEVGERR